ncbi:MAG: copper-binding protein [Bryobacteraceae bacterium]|nr:copper-binding protein [Bryobacteraceae bacterium]
MKRIFAMNRLMTVFAAALLTAVICLAQSVPAKKALTFQGKVETVNEAANSLKVNGEKVEGWMDAMIMDYKVDDPAIPKKLKAGDQITATVYEGDMVLHKVMVMPKTDNMKSKK